jgi:hydrogenase expression/formation protein HypD
MDLKTLSEGFRQPAVMRALADKIAQRAALLTQPLCIMEVCGGHTHTIMKYGLKQLLPKQLRFIHGPGCPVCVMPKHRIDQAIEMALQPNVIVVTLGDMIRVPGSRSSLAQCRAQGGQVKAVYDPMEALTIAREHPDQRVVYFAIGFETTSPMTAALVQMAQDQQLGNLLFHINHVLVLPAMEAILASGESPVNALIGPSHVSVITGTDLYQPLVDRYQVPLVVAGFEPVDVLESVLMLVEQALAGQARLEVQYSRATTSAGNLKAQALLQQVFDVRSEFEWRGLGVLPDSALQLRRELIDVDAEFKFAPQFHKLKAQATSEPRACCCVDILKGIATPVDCKLFGKSCQPNRPIGSCMVSSEGACHAYYRYGERDQG